LDLLDQRIEAALSLVYDPCSVAAGRPLSLVDMNLVTGWTFADGVLDITFCVTFAGCTMAPHFVEAAQAELEKIDGMHVVNTHIDTDHIWTPPNPKVITGTPQSWRTRVTPE
jgi:metal-sulfur cluster biosynthetic enzyme